ncbi:MAG: hypothetical protein WAP35_00420 [Solirubrobacterales bacterium]
MHAAEDGYLARVRLPSGRLSATQASTLATASRRGNGIVELTVRGNVQIRGLAAGSGASLAELLVEGGFSVAPTHERARNFIASPLAGRHPASLAETDEIVDTLDREIRADDRLSELSGRFLFAVDDGSNLISSDDADVALVAEADGAFRLQLTGLETEITVRADQAAALGLRAANTFLDLQSELGVRAWRLGEIASGPEQISRMLGTITRPRTPRTARRLECGTIEQRDGKFALTAMPPLGRLDGSTLDQLSKLLRAETTELRLSPTRTISVLDLPKSRVNAAQRDIARIGLAVAPNSGWEGLSACAGTGACAKALIDVRAAAALRAKASNRRTMRPSVEHWSACQRRCGEPKAAEITVAAQQSELCVRTSQAEVALKDVDAAIGLLNDREQSS